VNQLVPITSAALPTLAATTGEQAATAAALKPLVDTLATDVLGGDILHVDDTPVPVLAPGTGKTKTGRLWTYVRIPTKSPADSEMMSPSDTR
jgi:hypothetical protein